MKPGLRAALLLTASPLLVLCADTYQKPPQAVMDILNSPTTPTLSINPTHTYAIQGSPVRYPPLAELAEPMYRLAGIRINPKTNGLHNITYNTSITLIKIPEGTETKLALPPGAKVSVPRWTVDGTHYAFTNTTATATEIWVGDTAGRVHKVPNLRLNDLFGSALVAAGGGRGGAGGGSMQWMPDGKSLLVHAVRANRGAEPKAPNVPPGPDVQESLGGGKGAPTYEDLLATPHDEDLFEYYATTQLEIVDSVTGAAATIGKPAMIESAHMSPDGKYFIVTSIHKPFSYSYPARQFPTEVEVWDRAGKVVKKLQSIPMGGFGRGAGVGAGPADDDPEVVQQEGPRNFGWRPNEPATLIWYEGSGGGGRGGRGGGRASAATTQNAPPAPPAHEKVFAQKAPFTAAGEQIFEIDRRLNNGLLWTENGHTAIIDAGGGRGGGGGGGARGGRNPQPALLVDLDHPKDAPKTLWTRGGGRFVNPGNPMEKSTASGERVVMLDGDNVFLTGTGPSATGDHPFLSRYNLDTKETTSLFKCDDDHYEVAEALLDAHGDKFLTRRESPTEPPNYFVRNASGSMMAMTHYPDPQPIMRKVHKEQVDYKRPDGVDMSFTLYLPPDYKPGTKLPTVVWAYPREYEDADAAAEASAAGSQKHFTEIGGYSEIFFALDGYAVLDNASMPIVGASRTVNDTFVDQLVMDAKAAIDKAVEMGVTDPNRVGVGGHSYGGFMTDNLLAHTRLFRAGISESGAPNRTLTPFGFQNERRTLWEAPDTYMKMSPFMYADKIKDPLLLIHGEDDDNTGTFPIQSERLYEAVRGNGGTVRLVFLPYEAHGYRGFETIEHVNWEKLKWFDRYVKDAPPPGYNPGAQEKDKQK